MEHSSRAERKTKRRKTNRILNTAIAVVVLLIIVVAFTIFAGGNDEEPAQETKPQQEQTAAGASEEQPNEETAEEQDETEELAQETKPADEESAEKEVIVKDGTEPNVEQEIIDPNWKGVGTAQSDHVDSYDTESVDWQEKEQALSYATGIPYDNMTVWYISGNGPDAAIGTVSPKSDKNEAYRVYIKWVEGEGWAPTKVQKLKENDKGR